MYYCGGLTGMPPRAYTHLSWLEVYAGLRTHVGRRGVICMLLIPGSTAYISSCLAIRVAGIKLKNVLLVGPGTVFFLGWSKHFLCIFGLGLGVRDLLWQHFTCIDVQSVSAVTLGQEGVTGRITRLKKRNKKPKKQKLISCNIFYFCSWLCIHFNICKNKYET